MVRKRAIVHGRVQGVFFRDATQRTAREHGVSGWVRNTPEGTVEAVFEGEPGDVEALVRFVEAGPSRAGVEGVEVHDEEPEGLEGFDVR